MCWSSESCDLNSHTYVIPQQALILPPAEAGIVSRSNPRSSALFTSADLAHLRAGSFPAKLRRRQIGGRPRRFDSSSARDLQARVRRVSPVRSPPPVSVPWLKSVSGQALGRIPVPMISQDKVPGPLTARRQAFSSTNSTGSELETMSYTGENMANSFRVTALAALLTRMRTRTLL